MPGLRGVAAGGFEGLMTRRLTGSSRSSIYSGSSRRQDVAMKGNSTSATIHGVDGRKQVRRQRYRRGRWMVVTHGNRRQDFVFR